MARFCECCLVNKLSVSNKSGICFSCRLIIENFIRKCNLEVEKNADKKN